MPATRKFGRKKGPRVIFRRSLAANLIEKGKMTTTLARAKEIRPVVEKYITLAKKEEISKLRLLMAKLPKKAAYKVYHELAPKYKDRKGGYLRIIKTAKTRKRDGTAMAIIEFV
ncbi:MAG: 50S ribosomal protein L17 [Candidatus Harrisonbacteria bacterium CG10_big_fil_rev_8_21_14_0_10_45_28]|uniref:50S ribosomal protein L17 n=1 Tax=Candidatus Harrisonbacteria bacterium CG10_big_fil_rev_8_21_14_0_10_45_28 TaxID=1974586 RepID=A0A2H0UN15_9BACT|nr:MAG: 50S ribosomal protein L17 [Candidatus Harrisonbacteria bacterium CG10_big_fil_rev_8_21_14_0_10_45_28]